MGDLLQPTPKQLFDLYSLLSKDGKDSFLRLVATISTAREAHIIAAGLGLAEQREFSNLIHAVAFNHLLPILAREARIMARQSPDISDAEIERGVTDRMRETVEGYVDRLVETDRAQQKEERDRGSDPETIQRNVEICDRRKNDPKTWTQGKLAKEYGVTDGYIRKVLRKETEWRRKLAELSTDYSVLPVPSNRYSFSPANLQYQLISSAIPRRETGKNELCGAVGPSVRT